MKSLFILGMQVHSLNKDIQQAQVFRGRRQLDNFWLPAQILFKGLSIMEGLLLLLTQKRLWKLSNSL